MDVSQPLPIRVLFLTGTSEEEVMHPQVMRAGQELDLFGTFENHLVRNKIESPHTDRGKVSWQGDYFFRGGLPEHELGWQHTEANTALLLSLT